MVSYGHCLRVSVLLGVGLGCEPTGGLELSLELSEVGVTWPLSKLHVGSLGREKLEEPVSPAKGA